MRDGCCGIPAPCPRRSHDSHGRAVGHAQSIFACVAIRGADLFLLLARPHQRRLCLADDEQRFRARPGDVRDGRGRIFWGYVLFEVPSNIILEKLGARLWIARIMVTWGIISGLTAFATGPYSFMAIRFLLGWPRQGCFPGLYFTSPIGSPTRIARASTPASAWPCR